MPPPSGRSAADVEADVVRISAQLHEALEDNKQMRGEFERRVVALRDEAAAALRQRDDLLASKNDELASLRSELASLRAYVANPREIAAKAAPKRSEPDAPAREQVEALRQILAAQEGFLATLRGATPDRAPAATLLEAWREKVFALLLQAKSRELAAEKERVEARERMRGMEERLGEFERVAAVTRQIETALRAELFLEQQAARTLKANAAKLEARDKERERELSRAKASIASLRSGAAALAQGSIERVEESHKFATLRLDEFERRIGFAVERLATANALVREAAAKRNEGVTPAASPPPSLSAWGGGVEDEPRGWRAELAELREERVRLVSLAREERELFERKRREAEEEATRFARECAREIERLKIEARDAAADAKVERARADELTVGGGGSSPLVLPIAPPHSNLTPPKERVEALAAEVAKGHQEVREANDALADARRRDKLTADAAVRRATAELDSELALLRSENATLRRENAKNSAALRQVERQLARAREARGEEERARVEALEERLVAKEMALETVGGEGTRGGGGLTGGGAEGEERPAFKRATAGTKRRQGSSRWGGG
jgi:hypothetical protein